MFTGFMLWLAGLSIWMKILYILGTLLGIFCIAMMIVGIVATVKHIKRKKYERWLQGK